MAEKKKVRFIRRKGKIVPIRVSSDKDKRRKGAIQTAAGTAGALAAGRQIGKREKEIARRTAKIKRTRFNLNQASQMNPQFKELFGDSLKDIVGKENVKIARTKRTLGRIKLSTNILAGIFVQKGISNLLESKDDTAFEEFAKETVSQGTGIAIGVGAASKKFGPFKGSFRNLIRRIALRGR